MAIKNLLKQSRFINQASDRHFFVSGMGLCKKIFRKDITDMISFAKILHIYVNITCTFLQHPANALAILPCMSSTFATIIPEQAPADSNYPITF